MFYCSCVNIGGKIDLGLRFLGLRFPLVNSYFKYHADQTWSTVGGDQDQDESNKHACPTFNQKFIIIQLFVM
jgi:hypothetical protein